MSPENLIDVGFGTEIIYSFTIVVCNLMIYFGTKELYALSSHKGIKYFRQSFLFFALAYFFRSFIQFVLMGLGIHIRNLDTFGVWILLIFIYSSTMAIFYLVYSVMWKKWDKKIRSYHLHILAIVISLISISTGTVNILLTLQILLFLFVAVVSSPIYKKKKNHLYWIYVL